MDRQLRIQEAARRLDMESHSLLREVTPIRRQHRQLDRRNFLKHTAGFGAAVLAAVDTGNAAQVRTPAASGSIDAHAHWVPQAYADALSRLGRPTTSLHTPLELDANLDQRIKWMDEHGIAMHVLTLDGGMPSQSASRADAGRLARS